MDASLNEYAKVADARRLIREFLESEVSVSRGYDNSLRDVLNSSNPRLVIDLDHLDEWRPGISSHIMAQPSLFISAFDDELADYFIQNETSSSSTNDTKKTKTGVSRARTTLPRVGFTGTFGRYHVTPRGLASSMLGKLVKVDGIVIRLGLCRPKVRMSVHYCAATGDVRHKEHRDQGSLTTSLSSYGSVPMKDDQGNDFSWEYGLSVYGDFQRITVQEMPEHSPTGIIPRSCEVLATGDLCDKCKPGDRVSIFAVYKPVAAVYSGATDGISNAVLVAVELNQLNINFNANLTAHDIRQIKDLASRNDTFEVLSRSFAPAIAGRELEKKGLLLQLFGGVEKNLDNGSHLRGDINILLVGDPSCGKSQLLRFVMKNSPLCLSTTGRGSSGVGLTAAVSSDRETGERCLEAGAMVLADRGVVCIDEFDKMSTGDRVAIHEVMEQQTVTVAKAGIHATLNARCSVLAAANPIYGNFDSTRTLQENIALPDSLLSRFDLVFIVQDSNNEADDRRIAGQVLKQIRSRIGHHESGMSDKLKPHTTILEEVDAPISNNQGPQGTPSEIWISYPGMRHNEKGVTGDFFKKYIMYARSREPPKITDEVIASIAGIYCSLRRNAADAVSSGDRSANAMAVTARSLESLIRLSTAHAKLKLREELSLEDVEAAKDLMFASRGKTDEATSKKIVDENGTQKTHRKPEIRSRTRGVMEPHINPSETSQPSSSSNETNESQESSSGELLHCIMNVFAAERLQFCDLDELVGHVNRVFTDKGCEVKTKDEISNALHKLMDDNKVLINENLIFVI